MCLFHAQLFGFPCSALCFSNSAFQYTCLKINILTHQTHIFICNVFKQRDQVQFYWTVREWNILLRAKQVLPSLEKFSCQGFYPVSSHTTVLGDVQIKEYFAINSNTLTIMDLMTIGILVLVLQSVVTMSNKIVKPISNCYEENKY